ncbi:MAG: hypothetical protein WCD70_04215 [Alphaproteobacteria bacterium]
MKKIAIALLCLALICHEARAQDVVLDPCPPNANVPINIVPVFEEPTYNYDASIPDLQVLSQDAYHVIPEGLTLGLTHYQPMLRVNPVSLARDLPDGTTCVQVDHVDISFGYRNVVVYIANEIPQGTCGFDEVMGHEQKHVAVQKQILADFIPTLQSRLKDYLAQNGSFRGNDYGEAVTWMHDNVQYVAQDTINQVLNENTRLQHNIDTVEEYTRVGNACGGQLHGVVHNFMQNGQ